MIQLPSREKLVSVGASAVNNIFKLSMEPPDSGFRPEDISEAVLQAMLKEFNIPLFTETNALDYSHCWKFCENLTHLKNLSSTMRNKGAKP